MAAAGQSPRRRRPGARPPPASVLRCGHCLHTATAYAQAERRAACDRASLSQGDEATRRPRVTRAARCSTPMRVIVVPAVVAKGSQGTVMRVSGLDPLDSRRVTAPAQEGTGKGRAASSKGQKGGPHRACRGINRSWLLSDTPARRSLLQVTEDQKQHGRSWMMMGFPQGQQLRRLGCQSFLSTSSSSVQD
jgi:hypothetical protein